MKRLIVVTLFLFVIVSAFGCKGNGGGETGGGGGGGPAPSPESTAIYFGLSTDSAFIYWDSTASSSSGTSLDTVKTRFYSYIASGGRIYIPHSDSFFTSGRVLRDTFIASADSLYQFVKISLDTSLRDTITLSVLMGIKPLNIGNTWIPIYPQTKGLTDTIAYPFIATCTLMVRLDSLRVDSSYADVIDSLTVTVPAGTFSTFRIAYKNHMKVFYGLFTSPSGCLPISGDTFGTINSYDTVYIKPYYGMVKRRGRDSTVFNTPMGSQIEIIARYRALTGKR